MENIHCIVISFKQLPEYPEHIYFVSDREIKENDLYIDPTQNNFLKVGRMYKQDISPRCRKCEATTNERLIAEYNVQEIPKLFVEAYYKSDKSIKEAPLRVNTNK